MIYLVKSTILLTILEIFEIDKTLQIPGSDRHQKLLRQPLSLQRFFKSRDYF